MNNVQQAEAKIHQLIPQALCADGREQPTRNGHQVTFTVKHPKRKLSINSFANAAKKNGVAVYGTKSATNRNDYIVAYVNLDATTELCITGNNAGDIVVVVSVKA